MTQKNQIHNPPPQNPSLRSVLILSSYTRLDIPNAIFLQVSRPNFLHTYHSVQILKLLVTCMSPFCYHILPPRLKYAPQHPSRNLTTTDPQTTGPIMVECTFTLKSARSRQGVFQTVPRFPLPSCRCCLFTEEHFCSLFGEYTAPMGAAQ
jgi:hypothetical protein